MVAAAVTAAASVSHHHLCGCHVGAPPNLQPVRRQMSPVVLARRPRVLVSRAKFDKFDAATDGPPSTPGIPTSEVSAVAEGLELDEDRFDCHQIMKLRIGDSYEFEKEELFLLSHEAQFFKLILVLFLCILPRNNI